MALIWALSPDQERAWLTVRETSWTVTQRCSSHLLVYNTVIRQHTHQKASWVPSPHLCLWPAEYVYQGDSITQIALTTQSICSLRNERYILQNHIATSFLLLWVLSTTGNHGVQGGETMRAAAPWSGAKSISDPRKLQEVQGLVVSQSWDTLVQNLDYVLIICSHNIFS